MSERRPSRARWEDCLCQGLLTTEVVAYLEMLARGEQEQAAQKPYEHPSGEAARKNEGGKG